MNQKKEKSIEVYTPNHINELKLYNSVSMKESSEMVREIPDIFLFRWLGFESRNRNTTKHNT